MTQASDLGGIPNQLAAFYRARVNVNFQALTTQHYGATQPPITYPNMLWFDAGTGYVKLRDPTNTAWWTVGTIGPPMKWTNVDIPQTAFTTGDVKLTYKTVADAGWVMMNDGSIGDGSSGATTRANPDTWLLFNLLWSVASDDWCKVYAAGTWTPTGRTNPANDFNLHRHMVLPKVLGRAFSGGGWGAGLSSLGLATWQGAEYVGLTTDQMPAHYHNAPAHAHSMPVHGHPYRVDRSDQKSWNSSGQGAFPTSGGGDTTGGFSGWPDANDDHVIGGGGGGWTSTDGGYATSWSGSGAGHFNIQPTTYVNVMIKL